MKLESRRNRNSSNRNQSIKSSESKISSNKGGELQTFNVDMYGASSNSTPYQNEHQFEVSLQTLDVDKNYEIVTQTV